MPRQVIPPWTRFKTIVRSRTYQLSAIPNDFNKHDKQAYARYYPKRMAAEVQARAERK